jgi:mannose-6-phosphate isomerase-like protein (cupin superfamily)
MVLPLSNYNKKSYHTRMKGFVANIEQLSLDNGLFRRVLYTAKNSQLVLMSLQPNQDIGEEVHQLDQFIRVEKGQGKAVLDGVQHQLKDGFVVLVPAGARHNIINTSVSEPLKLYTLYSPPNHRDGVQHTTKEQAESDSEHFDGTTTE